MTPKVSVIVPVYKAEAYLHRCVDSLLAQTFTDFEILLIDDGSPDRSDEICDEYAKKDSRIRVFHKENGGVSSARQCGMDHATGEYTIHADPDDWVEPTMLEELYTKAKEEDADMVICDFYVNYEKKQIYKKQEPSALAYETVLKEMFQQLHGSCWNKLVRRVCYNKYDIRFPEELSFCEDLYVNTSLLCHDLRICYYPKAFYHYVKGVNSNSIVYHYDLSTYNYDVMLLSKFQELFVDHPYLKEAISNSAYLIIYRAFVAHVFTASEFKKYCKPYIKHISSQGKNRFVVWLLYLSCIGGYEVAYNVYKWIRHVKG